MLWVLLALTGAIANAAYYIIVRKYITALDPRVLTGSGFLVGSFLLFVISGTQGFPPIGPDYYTAVIVSASLNIISLPLIFKALSSSDISLSMPMLSFTPVFLIATSYLLLNEMPSLSGMAGICIIVAGSYVLNISGEHEHFLDPVRSMMKNSGSWYMLIVAFLFAASINYDKIAMLNSDPAFGMAFTLLAIGCALLILPALTPVKKWLVASGQNRAISRLSFPVKSLRPYVFPAIIIGFFAAIESVSINLAYTMQIVPYVISLKRMGIIVMVLYGTIVCAEEGLAMRLLGSSLMVAGAVMILLST